MIETALKTADSGYPTRELADVAQDVVITMGNCGTSRGITKGGHYEGEEVEVSLVRSIRGRVSRVNIVNPLSDQVVFKENEMITIDAARKLEERKTRSAEGARAGPRDCSLPPDDSQSNLPAPVKSG